MVCRSGMEGLGPFDRQPTTSIKPDTSQIGIAQDHSIEVVLENSNRGRPCPNQRPPRLQRHPRARDHRPRRRRPRQRRRPAGEQLKQLPALSYLGSSSQKRRGWHGEYYVRDLTTNRRARVTVHGKTQFYRGEEALTRNSPDDYA
jgi:hypothetical protein